MYVGYFWWRTILSFCCDCQGNKHVFVSLNVYFLIKGLHKVMKKDRQSTNAVEGQHSRMDVLEAMWRTVKGPKLTWMVWVGWKFVCCAHTVERSEMIIIMKRSCKLLNSRDTQMFSVQLVILVEQELLTHPSWPYANP
jgi:hypothetical protein